MNKQNKIIFLMGPTASGKTELAKKLVCNLPLEIISVDSAMIYRGMDIGTGKPSKQELTIAPHLLIDILDPAQSYSAAQFRRDALELIQQIHQRQHIPLCVGGTMLYFKTLKYGISKLPNANVKIRQQLEQEKQKLGLKKLHERLEKIDPIAAARIHYNDSQRLLRALEVYAISGKPMTEYFNPEIALTEHYDLLEIAIAPTSRELLHDKIAKRFEKMLAMGLLDEVRSLFDRGDLNITMPSIRAVGYRQVWEYLDNKCDYETMKDKAISATRQLAKRQLTWLRSWEDLNYFDSEDESLYEKIRELI